MLLTKVIIDDNFEARQSREFVKNRQKENTREKCIVKRSTTPREDVVRQLKEVRKAEGMTQEHLAELVGTKKSNISRLESGRYNPSLDFLVKVADGLGKQITVKIMSK